MVPCLGQGSTTCSIATWGASKQEHPGEDAVGHKRHLHLQREKFCWMPVIPVDLQGGFCCTEISFLFVLQSGIVLEEMALKL